MAPTSNDPREVERLSRYYASLGDEELLHLADERDTLTDAANEALSGVLSARDLAPAGAEAEPPPEPEGVSGADASGSAGAGSAPAPSAPAVPRRSRALPVMELPPPVGGRAFEEERRRLAATYGGWNDAELAALALEWETLTDAAKFALDDAIKARQLTADDLAAAAAELEPEEEESAEQEEAIEDEDARQQLLLYLGHADNAALETMLQQGNLGAGARALIEEMLEKRTGVEAPAELVVAGTFANGADASYAAEALSGEGIECAIGDGSEGAENDGAASILVYVADLEAARKILKELEFDDE